uniref:Extracellular membrane protein CFEM domain-containing protein n=1 Tax=Moniliophthora roreri TaxID=221103 RepID=A0A0W0FBS0_MONRR
MHISTLLFAVICGMVLTVAADCIGDCRAPSKCNAYTPDVIGCLCNEKERMTAEANCMKEKCDDQTYQKAIELVNKNCAEYTRNPKEEYPSQNCVNSCKNGLLEDYNCPKHGWDCFCKIPKKEKHLTKCFESVNCLSDAAQKLLKVVQKNCGESNEQSGGEKSGRAVPRSLQEEHLSPYREIMKF